MAVVLCDTEIQGLLGSVIANGDPACIRPNSYILRLGGEGEFLNVGKEFKLGKDDKKKGIIIQPGHSVGVIALETLDFRRETVHELYPEHDLHGLLSPTTDLSREGIVAPATQVDAGFHGTLNWTLTNTSSEERRFMYGERIFRLTILRLEEGETAKRAYEGYYHEQFGYVPSKRPGAPAGMKETEWEDSRIEGGPRELLENLIRSGYPWNLLGQQLKDIDGQFVSVTEEYARVHDSINKLTRTVEEIRSESERVIKEMPRRVREVLKEEAVSLQNRWLISSGSFIFALVGLGLAIVSNQKALGFLKGNGFWLGLVILFLALGVQFLATQFRRTAK